MAKKGIVTLLVDFHKKEMGAVNWGPEKLAKLPETQPDKQLETAHVVGAPYGQGSKNPEMGFHWF